MEAVLFAAQVASGIAASGPIGAAAVACCVLCPGLSFWVAGQATKLAWTTARGATSTMLSCCRYVVASKDSR